MKYTVGIFGGMGSGKSTVIARLKDLGANVLDADKVNAELAGNAEYLHAVQKLCPQCVKGGTLDKSVLRDWVWASPDNRQAIMDLAHPMIAAVLAERSREGLWFIEFSVYVPGFMPLDESWHIVSAPETRLKRVMKRGGWTEEQVKAAIRMQTEAGVAPAEAVIISNDGEEARLLAQVDALYAAIKEKAATNA